MMRHRLPFLLILVATTLSAEDLTTDVCIYGATPAGIAAAISVAKGGKTVVLLEPGRHAGGMHVEGLGGSDIDNHGDFRNAAAVGGLAKEFYLRLGTAYGKTGPVYRFEPHTAEAVLAAWLAEQRIVPRFGERLVLGAGGVTKNGATLASIRLDSGLRVAAKIFIDATLEGDLLAGAGVSTVIGRESNATYGETKNGIRAESPHAQFTVRVDPFRIPGDATSGLIPTIQDEPFGTPGDGDRHLQGYCFRLCFTDVPANRLPFPKPAAYDRGQYEIYLRYFRAGGKLFSPSANLPNRKTDLGSWHDLSLNLYGMNLDYPGGDHATRARVIAEHLAFTQGLCWFLVNDPEVPEAVRKRWSDWGPCRDEFTDNGGWPRVFYVRDARRMVSDYVVTELHTRKVDPTAVEDPIAVAYWPPDTHHVRRIVRSGAAYNEGFVFGGKDWGPFGVSYRALVPKATECSNLLAPSCPSSSHVAYGAIRLEWTFMALGQASGDAAVLAIEQQVPVQRVPYAALRERLLAGGQVVELPTPR